jgi:hypothetical protein
VGLLEWTIQRRVLDSPAMRLLEGEVHEGDHVIVDATPTGELVFDRAALPQSAAAWLNRPGWGDPPRPAVVLMSRHQMPNRC